MKITTALISVSDKTGIVDFAKFLDNRGIEILSTGGTARKLVVAGIAVREVADYTGFPEILDGRVKTLNPKIHGGILGRRDVASHLVTMATHDIIPIDLVIVNLYPFEKTIESDVDFETCIENIDIGGPAMIRSAAKNHNSVTIVVNPEKYEDVMGEMEENNNETSLLTRYALATEAYTHTAAYDTAIFKWFQNNSTEFYSNLVSK